MKYRILLATVATALLTTAPAHATVITFEDLPGTPYFVSLPANYAGISWAANFWAYADPQDPYTPHSGTVRVATNGDNPGDSSFDFGSDVVFEGAWFAGEPGYSPIGFLLYNNGTLVHTSSTLPANNIPTFLSSGYSGLVDRVVLIGTDGFYVMDDVTFQAAAASIPEPETYAMLLAGLGVLGFVGKRRKAS